MGAESAATSDAIALSSLEEETEGATWIGAKAAVDTTAETETEAVDGQSPVAEVILDRTETPTDEATKNLTHDRPFDAIAPTQEACPAGALPPDKQEEVQATTEFQRSFNKLMIH